MHGTSRCHVDKILPSIHANAWSIVRNSRWTLIRMKWVGVCLSTISRRHDDLRDQPNNCNRYAIKWKRFLLDDSSHRRMKDWADAQLSINDETGKEAFTTKRKTNVGSTLTVLERSWNLLSCLIERVGRRVWRFTRKYDWSSNYLLELCRLSGDSWISKQTLNRDHCCGSNRKCVETWIILHEIISIQNMCYFTGHVPFSHTTHFIPTAPLWNFSSTYL